MANWGVWAVHLLTASGAALALLAALAAEREAWQLAFLCLGIALLVDGIDGPLARRLEVAMRLPWLNGATLDLVVDYATYVFVPALVVAGGLLLSRPLAITAAIGIAVVGALYFADTRMKTRDAAFRGFPAVWNVAVYELAVLRLPEAATFAVLVVLGVLTFLPVEFVHPLRVKRWRPLTLAMTAAWAALALWALAAELTLPPAALVAFAASAAYFLLAGFVLQLTRA
jgi:phosphatidylcholine synthase